MADQNAERRPQEDGAQPVGQDHDQDNAVNLDGQGPGVAVPVTGDTSSVAVGAVPADAFTEVWEGDRAGIEKAPAPSWSRPRPRSDKLQPKHLAELRALGVDDETIARLKMATYYDERGPVGWAFDWTDGVDTVRALIPDRDKRRGPKVEWPKGQTLIVGCIRYVAGSDVTRLWRVRQALAVGAYAPADMSVWVMNGSNGIHRKIVDRLVACFAGGEVTIVTDADWRSNGQVGKAADRGRARAPDPGRGRQRLGCRRARQGHGRDRRPDPDDVGGRAGH